MSSTGKKSQTFTAEERAAMRARARELKAAAEGEEAVIGALKEMSPEDRALGERIHAIVKESAPVAASATIVPRKPVRSRQWARTSARAGRWRRYLPSASAPTAPGRV